MREWEGAYFDRKDNCDDHHEKRYYEYDRCKRDDDKKKCPKIVLACGQVCEEVVDILKCHHPCPVASVTVNLKKFKKPIVKIDFSSIIKFMDKDYGRWCFANGAFTLKLFRKDKCCNTKTCIGSWKFERFFDDKERSDRFFAATSDSFCFTKCDCPVCSECVEYVLVVFDKTFDEHFITKLDMKNINLNAIATECC